MTSKILWFARCVLLQGAILVVGALAWSSERPTPTPTPRPAGGTSLTEVAKSKQLKGAEKGKPIVISNENLSDYSSQRELTTASKKSQPASRPIHGGTGAGIVTNPAVSAAGHDDERKRYWQGRYKQQLDLIESAKNQIQKLDYEIPGLWRDFYAWDDPAYRDGVIKVNLDSALARRDALETQLRESEEELKQIKSSAREDGGEPGWFREIPIATPTKPKPEPTPGIVIY
jgi:hypothetical protein